MDVVVIIIIALAALIVAVVHKRKLEKEDYERAASIQRSAERSGKKSYEYKSNSTSTSSLTCTVTREHHEPTSSEISKNVSRIGMRIFPAYPNSVLTETEEIIRLKRACSSMMFVNQRNEDGSCDVYSKGNIYKVSLLGCECEDFKKRNKPCKHMLFWAGELGALSPRQVFGYDTDYEFPHFSPSTIDNSRFYGNNLNYKRYRIKVRRKSNNGWSYFVQEAYDEDSICDTLDAQYYDLSTIVVREEIPFDPPTEDQLLYAKKLGVKIPSKACIRDVSALLDNEEGAPPAPEVLFQFADRRKLCFSYYRDEKWLIEAILNSMNEQEKIAFLILCMVKHEKNRWYLGKSSFELAMDQANHLMHVSEFMNSYKRNYSQYTNGFDSECISFGTNAAKMLKKAAERW